LTRVVRLVEDFEAGLQVLLGRQVLELDQLKAATEQVPIENTVRSVLVLSFSVMLVLVLLRIVSFEGLEWLRKLVFEN